MKVSEAIVAALDKLHPNNMEAWERHSDARRPVAQSFYDLAAALARDYPDDPSTLVGIGMLMVSRSNFMFAARKRQLNVRYFKPRDGLAHTMGLVPQKVDNLLVAGRCASMTHEGQSAARASGGCFVMGQAAGTAAANIGNGRGSVRDIDVKALQQQLRADGAMLG